MKTLLFLSVIFLSGCGCVLPQTVPRIPDQFVYATDTSCSAFVPDFTELIKGADNCKLLFWVQKPGPDWLLTPENPTAMVTVRIGDFSGNINELGPFSVTLVDTIKPIFIIDSSLLASWEMVDKIYNIADQALKELVFKDQILADASFMPHQVGSFYADGLTRKRYPVLNSTTSKGVTTWNPDAVFQVDSAFLEKTLVIRVPPNRKRLFTFE